MDSILATQFSIPTTNFQKMETGLTIKLKWGEILGNTKLPNRALHKSTFVLYKLPTLICYYRKLIHPLKLMDLGKG